MIHVIKTEEIIEDDVEYIVETYSNGNTIKYVKPSDEPLPPDPMADTISDEEQARLEMQTNIEYLVEIADMNNMEV